VPTVAAFFDLDKTVIATSATLAFSRQFRAAGLITRRAMARAAYARVVFMTAGADAAFMERVKGSTSRALVGWPAAEVRRIVTEAVPDVIGPVVYPEARELLAEHRRAGHDLVLVSSSGEEVVQPIGALLGIDHVIATRMHVADGRYSGEFEFFAYSEEKVTAVRRLAVEHGYDLTASFAYSDSITDAPLLRCVGHPTAVNPDKELRRLARANGWPIRTFTRPRARPA
jgi:HAD superfamily hydrolase (TIGR01490 family)